MTLLIAGYDVAQVIKNKANYVCDGINDEIEIMAAMNALGNGYWAEIQMIGSFNTRPYDGTGFGLIMNRSKTLWRGPAKLSHTGGGDLAIVGDHAYLQPITVTDVIVQDFEMTSEGGSIGIGLDQRDTSISRIIFKQLYIHDCGRDGPDMEMTAVNEGGLRDVKIQDCNIHDVRQGIDFSNHARKYIEGLIIEGNTIRNWIGAAIDVYGAFDDLSIRNNQCHTITGLGHGMDIGDSSQAGIGWPIRRSQIQGNVIAGITQTNKYGIFCYGFEDLKIIANSVYASRQGIYLARGIQDYSNQVKVIGNTVIVKGASIPAYAAEPDVRRQLITANHLESEGHYCLYFYGGSSTFLVALNHQLKAGLADGWTLARVIAGARGVIAANIANTLALTVDTPADVITDLAQIGSFPN